MSEPLTRGEVLALLPLATTERQVVKSGDEWYGVYSALLRMVETDAALRQQLAEVTKVWKAS